MTEVGLLHPVVVTEQKRLIAGGRRLAAARTLGWLEIPVTVVSSLTEAADVLRAESDENTCRKDFAPTEALAIKKAREELLRPLAQVAQAEGGQRGGQAGGKLPQAPVGKVREAATVGTGYSATTLRKVETVEKIAAALETPEPVREVARQALVEMDRSGKVDRAHKAVQQAFVTAETRAVANFVESDQALQDSRYVTAFVGAIVKAGQLLKRDATSSAHLADHGGMGDARFVPILHAPR